MTFTCNATTPCVPGTPGCAPCVPGDPRPDCQALDVAVLQACDLKRSAAGVFTLDVTGTNIKDEAEVRINGVEPKKVRFRDQTGTDNSGRRIFSRLTLKGRLCANLPGSIVVTNPGARPSTPLVCNDRCPNN